LVYTAQCVACGEFITMIAQQVYCGWYGCIRCKEIGLFVPKTQATPQAPSEFTVVDYQTAEEFASFLQERR